MIEEIGHVTEVGPTYLKIASQPKSACGNCAAEKGCGQGVLNRWGTKPTTLTLLLNGRNPSEFSVEDQVVIGLNESSLLINTLVLYLTPLIAMILGVLLGNYLFSSDLGTAGIGALGLFAGALLSRTFLKFFSASSVEPVLLGKAKPVTS